MTQDDWNDGETPPTASGWYAIQICYDLQEGIHVYSVEFPSQGWDGFASHQPKWHGPHPSKQAAQDWGYAHDPEGPL